MRLRRRQAEARKPRRPRDSRTIPLWDETEQDNGMWYYCFHCGFPCSDKRDTLGGESSPNAVTHGDFPQESYGAETYSGAGESSEYVSGGSASAGVMLGGIFHTMVALREDAVGDEPVHYHTVSTRGGCPFCGSLNWRGDY